MSNNGKVFLYTRNAAGAFVQDGGAKGEYYIESPSKPSLSVFVCRCHRSVFGVGLTSLPPGLATNYLGQADFGFGDGFMWFGIRNSGSKS